MKTYTLYKVTALETVGEVRTFLMGRDVETPIHSDVGHCLAVIIIDGDVTLVSLDKSSLMAEMLDRKPHASTGELKVIDTIGDLKEVLERNPPIDNVRVCGALSPMTLDGLRLLHADFIDVDDNELEGA